MVSCNSIIARMLSSEVESKLCLFPLVRMIALAHVVHFISVVGPGLIAGYLILKGEVKDKQQQPQAERTTGHAYDWTFHPHSLFINNAV